MADHSFVNLRLDRRITDALCYYAPEGLCANTRLSARVRWALLSYLHERGSLVDIPRTVDSSPGTRSSSSGNRRPAAHRRRRRR